MLSLVFYNVRSQYYYFRGFCCLLSRLWFTSSESTVESGSKPFNNISRANLDFKIKIKNKLFITDINFKLKTFLRSRLHDSINLNYVKTFHWNAQYYCLLIIYNAESVTQFKLVWGSLSSLVWCQPRALEIVGSNPTGPTMISLLY